jgi:hypothetical protein
MATDVSVILIREAPEQMTGSGCCGKLEGDSLAFTADDVFPDARRGQREWGVLYRTLREFFPPDRVSVVTVDPRNQLFLLPKLWHDVCYYRPGWRAGLRTLLQWFSLPAVVVNGRILRGQAGRMDPDTVCHHVAQLLRK